MKNDNRSGSRQKRNPANVPQFTCTHPGCEHTAPSKYARKQHMKHCGRAVLERRTYDGRNEHAY